jgi:hypothetical protein
MSYRQRLSSFIIHIKKSGLFWDKEGINVENNTLDGFIFGIIFLMLGFMGFFTILNTLSIMEIDIWRHDAAYYLDEYTQKLKGEGRWVNYILFGMIKQIPAHLSIAICLSSFFIFCFSIANNADHPILYSFGFALLSVQIPVLYFQLLWPVTPLPAFILL